MRYFKYPHTKKTNKETYKAELAVFDERGKCLARKAKIWDIFAKIILVAVGVTVFILLSVLFSAVDLPTSEIVFVKILFTVAYTIFSIVWRLASIVLAGVLGALAAIPFWNVQEKAEKELKTLRREHIRELSQKAGEHLAKFYGLKEPYMVTKCYACTDNKFKNKDVCAFRCDGEIRIVRLLYNVIDLNECDIGCYAFEPCELSLCYGEYKGKKAAELTAGETKFTLAARAKPFIEKLLKNGEN